MRGTATIQQSNGQSIQIPPVAIDAIGIQERAQFFTKRSIKKSSKLDVLYKIIEMIDLTTLEGADTPGKVKQLCHKALYPVSPTLHSELSGYKNFRPIPSVGAVCVYPNLVSIAAATLEGTNVEIASVATGFPSGQVDIETRLREVEKAIQEGATEIDMVINRNAFLVGDYQTVFNEIQMTKETCGETHLKVILETGELGSFELIRLASDIAMEAGGDFIKTSTGKISSAASIPVTLVMLQSISDFYDRTGKRIGMKPAGGIRTAKQAIQYLVMVNETLDSHWLNSNLFRFGASSLLNDVLKQIYKQITGRYYYDREFSLD